MNIQDGAAHFVIAFLLLGLRFQVLCAVKPSNLAIIAVPFNYAKRRLDILRLRSFMARRLDRQSGRRN